MSKFVSMSDKPGMNAMNTDFTKPGEGLKQAGVTLQNLNAKWGKLYKDRANKAGGSKQLWGNLARWTTTPNAQQFVKRYPQQAALFNKSIQTGVIQEGLTPQTLMAALDWGVRENDRSQQHKSNFLDSVWGQLLGKLVQVGIGFIPGIGTAAAMAMGAGIGAAQAAAMTRPSGMSIAIGAASGAATAYGGVKLNEGITSAGGVGNYVKNGVDAVGNFIKHPINSLNGSMSELGAPALNNVNQFMPADVGSRAITTAAASSGNALAGRVIDAAGNVISSANGSTAGGAPSIIDRAGNVVSKAVGGPVDLVDIIKGGTDILGTLLNNKSNDNSSDAIRLAVAADAQARKEARADLEKGYGRVEKINAPGVKAYGSAMGTLDPLLTTGKVKVGSKTLTADQWMQTVDPGYQFRLGEGERLISSRQASAGDRLSGRARKELMRYGQGYASSEFDSSVRRLHNLASLGDQAVGRVGNAAMGSGSANANLTLQGGETNANAIMANAGLENQNRTNWGNTASNIGASIYDRYRNSTSGARYVGA